MKSLVLLAFLLIVNKACSSDSSKQFRIVCSFKEEHVIKGDNFTIDDIDSTLCTHVIYEGAFINFRTNEIQSKFPQQNITIDNNRYEKIASLKSKNPQLKVMFSLRYWQNPNISYTAAASDNVTLTKFVENAVKFLEQLKFDGIDFDFGYPWTQAESDFAVAFRQALPSKYLLSASIYHFNTIEKDDAIRLSQNLDFLNLITYYYNLPDWNLATPDFADHHTPLYGNASNSNSSIDSTVQYWIDKEFPADKIVMNIALFGFRWTLSSNETKPPAPAVAYDFNTLTISDYRVIYRDICEIVRNEGWEVFQDTDKKMGPYAVSPLNSNNTRQWVSYDDPEMAIIKSKYVISKGLSGVLVSDVSFDDYRNTCVGGTNPLLTAIANTLKKSTPNELDLNRSSAGDNYLTGNTENVLCQEAVSIFELIASIAAYITEN